MTVNKPCERFASHNPEVQCAADVSKYVNGESLVGQDIVLWYGITFHHLPRDEDEGMVDAHWDGFQLTPRDWTATNPLDNVVLGPPATPTATSPDTPVPPTSTSTSTSVPTPTYTATVPAVALPTESYTPTPTNTATAAPTNTPVTQTPTPIGGVGGTPAPPGIGNLAHPLFLPQITR